MLFLLQYQFFNTLKMKKNYLDLFYDLYSSYSNWFWSPNLKRSNMVYRCQCWPQSLPERSSSWKISVFTQNNCSWVILKEFYYRFFSVNDTKFFRTISEVHLEPSQTFKMEVYMVIWPLHKKWSFPLRISPVNVTKSTGNCGFGHTCWKNS